MSAGYLPGFTWVPNARNGGGTYQTAFYPYPWRICLHTIDGGLSRGSVAGHGVPPHLWYSPARREGYQTIPLSRSSFATWQPPNAPHYTNKARCIQVELEGTAATAGDWPDEWLRNVAEDVLVPICRWVESVGGRIDLGNVAATGAIGGSARANAPQRLTWQQWADFTGVCSHRHVPENGDRWDTGYLDVPRICAIAQELMGGLAPAARPEQELEVYDFAERPGQPFPWTGFALPVLAMDSAVVRKGDTIVVNSTRPGRARNVALLSVSGATTPALLNWGAPVEFTAAEDGWTVVLTEADEGPGIIRVQGRKG